MPMNAIVGELSSDSESGPHSLTSFVWLNFSFCPRPEQQPPRAEAKDDPPKALT